MNYKPQADGKFKQMFEKIKHIYFIGIGGVGMAGIAQVLHNLGYIVSGSDIKSSETTRRLSRMGIKVFLGHRAAQVRGVDVVVVSTAIPAVNPEIEEAKKEHIPIIPRAEMLAELMRLKYGIAVAGTHGKTTTTSLISLILTKGNMDPTVIVGGKVNHLNSNAKSGEGKYLVAEADESDGSFLTLNPTIVVVTNIDNDHLDYYGNIENIKSDFLKFINKIPFYGVALLCYDDDKIKNLLPQVKRKYITYGLSSQTDITAVNITLNAMGSTFELIYQGKNLGEFKLKLLGKHNLTNALGAIGVGVVLGISLDKIKEALNDFRGVERRLQILGRRSGSIIIDDYGHHPTEIEATLSAIKNRWPERKIKVVFQPHRYSRTQLLHQDFGRALRLADEIIITDIYPAGEKPVEGVTSRLIVDSLQNEARPVRYHPIVDEDLKNKVLSELSGNEVILTLGAGDIVKLGKAILGKTELNQGGLANWKEELSWLLRGKLKFDEPMSKHTSFGVGGPAEAWVEPRDLEDLKNLMVLIEKHQLKYLVIGKGSNIIVKDKGIRGLVINLSRYFRKIETDKEVIEVEAGLSLSDLIFSLEKKALSGLEFLKGVPGTVGGAVWMNAGLADKNIGSFVQGIKIITEKGEIKEFNPDEYKFSYRKLILPEKGIIYAVTLKLALSSKKLVKDTGRDYLRKKMDTQPLAYASAGCIFKNPDGLKASILIDELNLKGFCQGGAEVSTQHANFIVKKKEATAADIINLIQIIEKTVKEKQGINLEKEVIVVGED